MPRMKYLFFPLIALYLVSTAVYVQATVEPPECLEAKVEPGSPRGYFHFEYVMRKIVVMGCIGTKEGRKIGAKFILDTGAEQTALSPSLVNYAGLKTLANKRNILTADQVIPETQVELAALTVNGKEIKNVTALVNEALDRASELYRYQFGGTVGLDVLSRYVMSIDFPYRRVALFDKPTSIISSDEVARFPFELQHGQMRLRGTLPTGAQLSLIFDTGLGADTDVMLYEDSIEGIELLPPTYSTPLEDGVTLRVGRIPWINFEGMHIDSPTVGLNPSKVPNVFGERYTPGLVGPILFENYTIEIDFQKLVVRVLRTKPRLQTQGTGTKTSHAKLPPK